MPFHLFKTCIRNPSLFFISVFPLPPDFTTRDGNRDRRAYIYTWGGEFCEVFMFAKLV
jgi:hypothetical protein